MEKIEEFNGEAEKAGDDGDVEKAMEFMDKAKALKAGLDQIIEDEQKKIRMNGAERKLIICEICANFMSSKDNDERMQDHCEALPPPPPSRHALRPPPACPLSVRRAKCAQGRTQCGIGPTTASCDLAVHGES